MDNVMKEVCEEKHSSIDYKINIVSTDVSNNIERIRKVEDAIIMLTNMAETTAKRDIFDKILIFAVLITSVVLGAIILGPELMGKFIGGISK
jgi:hypothetical protein